MKTVDIMGNKGKSATSCYSIEFVRDDSYTVKVRQRLLLLLSPVSDSDNDKYKTKTRYHDMRPTNDR